MGATGTALLDFGAFPGASDASVAVTGQTAILAGSIPGADLLPVATADHSADEHLVETIRIVAGAVVAGVGFTIYGVNASQLNEPLEPVGPGQNTGPGEVSRGRGGLGTRLYGKWTVAWAWA